MKFWFYMFCLSLLTLAAAAQELSVPRLFEMLDWNHTRIDTTLKKSGYILMQKDLDSSSSLYLYSHLDRQQEAPTTLRSFAYMDVKAGTLASRLVTYRTYSEAEYLAIASWLLSNGWQTKEKFDFGESKHTIYTNGTQTIRMKVTNTKLKSGKVFTSYEVEIGK